MRLNPAIIVIFGKIVSKYQFIDAMSCTYTKELPNFRGIDSSFKCDLNFKDVRATNRRRFLLLGIYFINISCEFS